MKVTYLTTCEYLAFFEYEENIFFGVSQYQPRLWQSMFCNIRCKEVSNITVLRIYEYSVLCCRDNDYEVVCVDNFENNWSRQLFKVAWNICLFKMQAYLWNVWELLKTFQVRRSCLFSFWISVSANIMEYNIQYTSDSVALLSTKCFRMVKRSCQDIA